MIFSCRNEKNKEILELEVYFENNFLCTESYIDIENYTNIYDQLTDRSKQEFSKDTANLYRIYDKINNELFQVYDKKITEPQQDKIIEFVRNSIFEYSNKYILNKVED